MMSSQLFSCMSWLRPPKNYIDWKINNYQPIELPVSWLLVVFFQAIMTIGKPIYYSLCFFQFLLIVSRYLRWSSRKPYTQNRLVKQLTLTAFLITLTIQVSHVAFTYVNFALYSLIQQEVYRKIPQVSSKVLVFAIQISIRFALQPTLQLEELTCWVAQIILTMESESKSRDTFQVQSSLTSVINSIQNAVCIVKNNNQLLYSNFSYQQLAINLNRNLKGATTADQQALLHAQLQLIRNLHLDEVTLPRSSIPSFHSKIFDDEDAYRISRVEFGENDIHSEYQSELYDPELSEVIESPYFSNQLFGHQILTKKTFYSEVKVSFELDNQPQSYVQSAIRRKLRHSQAQVKEPRFHKSSTQSNPIQLFAMPTPRNRNQSLAIHQQRKRFSSQLQKLEVKETIKVPSIVKQSVKLMINMTQSVVNESEDQYKVYVMQDLTQAITKQKLEEMDRVKRNLFRSISHDLVTYLNGAHGYLQEAKSCMGELQSATVSNMIESAFRCIKLQIYKTYDFSDFRDIINETFSLRMDHVSLNEIIDECVYLIKDQISNKGIELQLDLPSQNIYVIADQQRLCQVLLNLLSNAIRFTEYGSISLSVKTIPMQMNDEGEHNVSIELILGKILEVRVKDSGIGLDQDKLGVLAKKVQIFINKQLQILDEYEKVSKDSVGIGMGLAVCKHILQEISPNDFKQLCVTSEQGVGTEFSFYLQTPSGQSISPEQSFKPADLSFSEYSPLNSVSEIGIVRSNDFRPSRISKAIQGQTECSCKDILIVDDEDFNIQALQLIIRRFGFAITKAYNGKEALTKIHAKLSRVCSPVCTIYRVILMDINMPIMNGWEAVKQIRVIEGDSHLKPLLIIAVTGFCSMEDKGKCIESGFDAVIIKPATKKILSEMLVKFGVVLHLE